MIQYFLRVLIPENQTKIQSQQTVAKYTLLLQKSSQL
jgi:hypothetical protein